MFVWVFQCYLSYQTGVAGPKGEPGPQGQTGPPGVELQKDCMCVSK